MDSPQLWQTSCCPWAAFMSFKCQSWIRSYFFHGEAQHPRNCSQVRIFPGSTFFITPPTYEMALSPHADAGDFFLKLRIWYIPSVPLQGLQRAGKVMPCANVQVWLCILKEILTISRKKKCPQMTCSSWWEMLNCVKCWRASCPLDIPSLSFWGSNDKVEMCVCV